jgi:hypothetical protein
LEKIKGVRKLATSAETFESQLLKSNELFQVKKVALEPSHLF